MAKRATKKVAVKKTTRTKAATAKSAPAKSARRVVKPWTKDDVRALKAHSKARTPVAKISREMKRTVGALRRRAGILGIGLGERR
ncbi:MAG: hypothetical protein AB1508_12590 [Pseudomonadota bacterium]